MQELTLGDIFSFLKQSGAILQEGPVFDVLEEAFHARRSLQPAQIAELLKKLEEVTGSHVQPNTNPLIPTSCFQDIPYPIAYLLDRTNEQYAELVQLLFLCDAIETTVRWMVNVAVLAVCHENNQRIPTGVASAINDLIKRPSFGKWVGILRNLRLAIADQKGWFLGKNDIPSEEIDAFIDIRNGIAHGNIQGNITPELKKAVELAVQILEKTTQLHQLPFVVRHQNQVFSFIGPTLERLSAPPAEFVEDGLYCIYNEHYLKLPILFELQPSSSAEPLIGSYISSKGDLKKSIDGSSLEYTEINGDDIYHREDEDFMDRFIHLFQTNITIPANEQWKELLKKARSTSAEAWNVDIALIKTWRKLRLKTLEKEAHILWFGGPSQTGRSSLLLSSLTDFQQENNNLFLFLYRFSSVRTVEMTEEKDASSEERGQDLLERFVRRLRDAVFHWGLKELTSTEIDYHLKGDDLLADLEGRMKDFLSIRNQKKNGHPLVCIGLDDVHQLPSSARLRVPAPARPCPGWPWPANKYTRASAVHPPAASTLHCLGRKMHRHGPEDRVLDLLPSTWLSSLIA